MNKGLTQFAALDSLTGRAGRTSEEVTGAILAALKAPTLPGREAGLWAAEAAAVETLRLVQRARRIARDRSAVMFFLAEGN